MSALYDPPMSKPVLAVGLLATMAGAWYWAMLPPTPLVVSRRTVSHAPAAAPLRDVPAVRLADLAVEAASRPTPAERRNPFANVGSVAPAGHSARESVSTAAQPVSPGPPPAPVWPRLELIGMAEAPVGGRVVRTGILSGPHGVQHVRAGDVVEGVYRVERIDADAIDVRVLPDERVMRLTLRR